MELFYLKSREKWFIHMMNAYVMWVHDFSHISTSIHLSVKEYNTP